MVFLSKIINAKTVIITVIIYGITRKTVSNESVNNKTKIPICNFEKSYLLSAELELILPLPVTRQEITTITRDNKA
jgi:hypothetical protein